MRTLTNCVSFILVVLFVYLSLGENGLFKFHPSLMAISVSLRLTTKKKRNLTQYLH